MFMFTAVSHFLHAVRPEPDGAWQDFLDGETGSLELRKRADFIVLDRKLFEVASADINRAGFCGRSSRARRFIMRRTGTNAPVTRFRSAARSLGWIARARTHADCQTVRWCVSVDVTARPLTVGSQNCGQDFKPDSRPL
jgi:hypothetical protein